jgi:type IV pilus assembly protein PilM
MIFLKNIADQLKRHLFSTRDSLVAIAINGEAIRVVELSKKGNQYTVEKLLNYRVRGAVAEEAGSSGMDEKSRVLKKVVDELGLMGREVCSSVSTALVMSKVIVLPSSLTSVEIEHEVMLELDQFVPYPLEDISFDYEVQQDSGIDPEQIEVLLVASRRENVEDQFAVLSTAGLKPVVLDVDVYAMERAFTLLVHQFPEGVLEKPVAVFDFYESSVVQYVMYGGRTIYTREQALGGQQSQIQKESHSFYGAETVSLEKESLSNTLPVEDPVVIINNAMVVQQVLRGLQFYESANINDAIGYIVLAGDIDVDNGIDEGIRQQVGLAVLIANPFQEMVFSEQLEMMDKSPSLFMVASGLALRGVS